MDYDAPGLEVGFQIDTGGSFANLERLEGAMDAAEQRITRDAAMIERATGGMVQLGGATAQVTAFGNAADRASQTAARELARVEKAGEKLVASFDRQTAAFGMTRAELRGMKAEAAALAAEQQGLIELAGRIRAAEADLWGKEAFAARQESIARTNAAEDAAGREERALRRVNEQLREREKLDALMQDNFGVGRASAVSGGATFSALAERERGLELVQQEVAKQREMNSVLAERARIQSALERTTGVGAPRATDMGATYSALAARAAEEEAQAQTVAANATRRAAEEHARLAKAMQESHGAQMADAQAADALRLSTDPLYAATKRLNDAIAESTRLYQVGATPPAEYARQQEVLTGRLREAAGEHDRAAKAARGNAFAMRQLAIQMPDIVQGLLTGQKPMTVFIQQGGQIAQIGMMAEGGLKGFAAQIGRAALAFVPFAAAAAVAGVALWRWHEQVEKDAGLKTYADGLGLTQKEMKKLGDVGITTGDVLAGVGKTITDALSLDGVGGKIMDKLFSPDDAKQVQGFVASIYGVFVGGYNAITELWSEIAPAIGAYVSGAAKAAAGFFQPVVDAAKWVGNGVISLFSDIYNKVVGWVKALGAAVAPMFAAVGDTQTASTLSNLGAKLGSVFGKAYSNATQDFITGSNNVVTKIGENTVSSAQKRLKAEADKIKADRTPRAAKPDRHAEMLERESDAIEAQIRNLYKLAAAYKVSDGAALIAEARVKAESKAIKQRADVEAAVDREIRLSIAQRVSDAAKADAATRAQANAQAEVNRMVEAGLIPSERAGELVRERIADLPLLAALQAATDRKMLAEVEKINAALTDQRKARADLRAEQEKAAFDATMGAGANRLAELREEQRLVAATDMERTRGMARVRAEQEAAAKTYGSADAKRYIDQQVEIAEAQQRLIEGQNDWNQSLRFTADLFDAIDQSALAAARGMSDAFGSVGTALGDVLTITTGYYSADSRLREERDKNIREAGNSEAAVARENRLYALRSSSLQVNAFGNMATAAKGFFKEGSTGWKVLSGAEKAARAVEFALSVRAIAQDAIETGSKLASGAARTAANAVEAVTKAIASLPFPANIAAGAATIGALAAVGVSIAGSLGGGGRNNLPKANNGTGTVLGNPEAQSESIRRALDGLKDVDLLMLSTSRQMAASLRSIEDQIGGVASLVVRAGNVNADLKVNEGFQKNLIGSVLSKIPLIGGILGGLFGSKTETVGGGLYGKAQSLGGILNSGFDASYYSDVKKTSKFLGITTGTKYSTQYTGADAGLENQFTQILREFNNAIVAAAGPLGVATVDITSRLNGMVVDIGKIDLKGLSGEQIQEKLTAVFGATADRMASGAFPGFERFQKVGEGLFETVVRVSSTVEQVSASLAQLGTSAVSLGIDAKVGLAAQFESLSDMTSAIGSYADAFYTPAERNAAKLAQLGTVISGLGVKMPETLATFRALVEAQDLTTAAGRATYATLIQLGPAFADLKGSMEGAKSAADILAEREGLNRQLLELAGDTAALRELDLAKIDVSNRALQQQVWAVKDAQEAAKAAEELRNAWASVGNSIMDEVKRIRGLNGADGAGSYASLLGQFNAATEMARAGDQEAAKSLPGMSQALLKAAADTASSRQELDRVQAQTAASLEATLAMIERVASTSGAASAERMLEAMQMAPGAGAGTSEDEQQSRMATMGDELAALRREVVGLLTDVKSNTGRVAKTMDNVTLENGGAAISTVAA